MNNNQKKLKDKILDKIKTGNIKMKPKSYFALKTILVLALIVVTVVILSFLVSFVIFSIRESSRLFLLGFGDAGIRTFFITFPWFLLVIEIILLIIVDILLKHFKFAYKTPFIYLILSTTIFVMVISVFVSVTPVHETLYQEVVGNKLTALKAMYIDAKKPPSEEGVFRGIVVSINNEAIIIDSDDNDKDSDDGYKTIFFPKIKSGNIPSLNIGDLVLVACREGRDEKCYIYGLKIFNSMRVK